MGREEGVERQRVGQAPEERTHRNPVYLVNAEISSRFWKPSREGRDKADDALEMFGRGH